MTDLLPFANNTISTYAYEPFSYRIPNPNDVSYTMVTKTTISSNYFEASANDYVIFETTSNGIQIGTQTFTINALDASGNIAVSSSNTVGIAPGRFIDPATGNSYFGSNYTYYANTPITPVVLQAPFTIDRPTSTPALPPGLTFSAVTGNQVSIVGTPLTTVPQSNYLIIGKQTGTSKTISTSISFVISNERIRSFVSPADIISGMTIGTDILTTSITTEANGSVQYLWNPLPDGLYVQDAFNNTVNSGFVPSDPVNYIAIKGAPTLAAANAFKNANISSLTQSFLARRIAPTPVLSNTVPITFAFGETVLFEPTSNVQLYVDSPVTTGTASFRAETYFSNIVGISNIFSPNLRSDLSLSFIPSLSRADLSGTPTSAGTGTYTIRAVNSNNVFRDTTVNISISNDSVTIAPVVDTCYNFVLSRPADLSLNGYYPAPITFSGSSASGRPLVWSSPALSNVGLSLSGATIAGTPNTTASLQPLVIQANISGSPISATVNLQFAVLNDTITLSSLTSSQLTMIQNRPITAIQMSGSSLSSRPVVSFTAVGLPTGLSISTTGLITGTPTTDGTFAATITGSTGFASSSTPATFTVLKDNIIVVMVNTTETVPTVFSGVELRALTYSGADGTLTTAFSNQAPYQGSNFSTSFVGGTALSGNFSTVPVLLPQYRFFARGNAGGYTVDATVTATTNNAPTISRLMMGLESVSSIVPTPLTPPLGVARLVRSTSTPYQVGGLSPTSISYSASTLAWQNVAFIDSNEAVLLQNIPYGIHDVASSGRVSVATVGAYILRSTDGGATWSNVPSSNIQAIDASGGPVLSVGPNDYYPPNPLFGCVATDGASNWLAIAIGTGKNAVGPTSNILRTSSDNGATWVDTSTSLFVDVNSNTKLFYNAGRYFVMTDSNATRPLYYAEASNLSSWSIPTGLASPASYNDFAASNNTLLIVGSNGASSACYSSSNNGTTWTALPTDPYTYSGSAKFNTATYAHGLWTVSGQDSAGDYIVATSSNLSTWTLPFIGTPQSGAALVACEDGGAFQFLGGGIGSLAGRWTSNGNIALDVVASPGIFLPAFSTKRLVAQSYSNGTPTLTLSIPYDPSGIAFVSPTQSSYLNWQFVPISPITVQATPSQFLYYYVSGLPDGLTFTNDASGLLATISGTSVRYSDASQRVLLFAALGSNVAARSFTMRTILPTVTKIQSGASGVTSLLRQYTEVNAAVTARDSKALPAMEYRLGEFTSPEPPSVITATSDKCDC